MAVLQLLAALLSAENQIRGRKKPPISKEKLHADTHMLKGHYLSAACFARLIFGNNFGLLLSSYFKAYLF